MTAYSRRRMLQALSAASAGLLVSPKTFAFAAGSPELEVQVSSVSPHTVRLSVFAGKTAIANDGSLVRTAWPGPVSKFRGDFKPQEVRAGEVVVKVSRDPLGFVITSKSGEEVQKLSFDPQTGVVTFLSGNSPMLGLGEGGPQFDRRGSVDTMRSGQGGYHLATHGGRVPIPWIIGTSGWALFFHQPYGTFDFTGTESKFHPTGDALPLDIFLVAARDPKTIMAEYALLTGHAEKPPLWSFGYQQSHRTLASREEVLQEAKTFREKKLPCDTMIYLGTGFCPSGWNTENGSFVWNSRVFPDPKEVIDELHKDHFRVAVHSVILSDRLHGTVHDPCELSRFDEQSASCYWDTHRKVFAQGVDGWWPDEGDPLDIPSRLVRNRMYWEGPQIDRPNERPFALHRNGYAGMQRYGSFLWSGDVDSRWETLKTQVPIALNTGLSGVPFWGTDVGGFVPTSEFTAELYLRWFQFGAFCPLFRCHGRTWKLRLPWGWNTGDPGPVEINSYKQGAMPDASQFHNPNVEPICRKYLELRYRLLPYLYSAVHECAATGLPIMRALWLHDPDDPRAVACADQYLWGNDILVAPVVEKGATSRNVYLPKGSWFDFWTGERLAGGRDISRAVDLETMPLFVRAGAILPLGPVKQYVEEKVEEPLSLSIYPGADGAFLLYEDDGKSFNYRRGEWMGTKLSWDDNRRVLTLKLAEGSRMLAPMRRKIEVKLVENFQTVEFAGRPVEVRF
ncbi:MAG TPA: TIM-barrel domain-containing protein [Terriglobales bacterium]|nr:TIM-barrel domain-containing protein [Terriglobales bacterium]